MSAERTCRCGHTRNHPMIIPEREYTLWGWIQLSILGLTPKPERVVFRCGMCRQTLGATRDPKVLSGEIRIDPKHPRSTRAAAEDARAEDAKDQGADGQPPSPALSDVKNVEH